MSNNNRTSYIQSSKNNLNKRPSTNLTIGTTQERQKKISNNKKSKNELDH